MNKMNWSVKRDGNEPHSHEFPWLDIFQMDSSDKNWCLSLGKILKTWVKKIQICWISSNIVTFRNFDPFPFSSFKMDKSTAYIAMVADHKLTERFSISSSLGTESKAVHPNRSAKEEEDKWNEKDRISIQVELFSVILFSTSILDDELYKKYGNLLSKGNEVSCIYSRIQ